MKREFQLEGTINPKLKNRRMKIEIVGKEPENSPYVRIEDSAGSVLWLYDIDLKRFAKNLIKALYNDPARLPAK